LCAALIAPGVVVAAEPVLEFDCLVEARQSIDVRSPVEGVIEAVLVERGALVKKGQEIARLASGPERAAVNLARSRSKMEGDVKAAQTRVEITQKKWQRAEEILAQRTIRSPVNGVVAEVVLHPGELATSNQKDPIVRLQEIDPLNVELILPVAAFGKIREGQKAVVTLEQPVGGSYSARVEVVDRMVDAASGTFGVRLQLPNPDGRIPAGVKCRAKF